MKEAVHHVAIERVKLARENLSLRQTLDNCQERRKIIGRSYEEFCRHAQDDSLPSENIPLQRERDGHCVHFSRRLHGTVDDATRILGSSDTNSWPVVVAARSWGIEQSGSHYCVELQHLDFSSRVAVCNIPGNINLRAVTHSRDKQADEKRVDTCFVTITDFKKNALIREAEGQQQNIEWILEGACIATFTEVDDTTIDVVYLGRMF
ncbi:hypothetical protein V7S43_004632 [Phytophthora oleae]|uniref:Uncharacterized protein n=1 Tax=Phytophthora oleae TaxID=2107226 RepID=A0ABD3FVH5_9STRA